MDKLETSIKRFNLIFTNTNTKDDLVKDNFNIKKEKVCLASSYNLLELINVFNKSHNAFISEYDYLYKLKLGKNIFINDFYKYSDEGNNYRILDININRPTMINSNYTHLYLREINGKIRPFITNDVDFFSNDYYRINIKLNERYVRTYLDLFDKYSNLFSLYKLLKTGKIFNDGYFSLFTKIDSDNDSFVNANQKFTVSLGADFLISPGDYISITVNLGKTLDVDLDNSIVKLNGITEKMTKKKYMELLGKMYFNKAFIDLDENRHFIHNNYGDKIFKKTKI